MTDTIAEGKGPICFRRIVLTVQMVMTAVMSFLIFSSGKTPGLEMAGLILLTLFLWWMRDRVRWLDFAPFLLLIFTYEVIRTVILAVGTDGVHVSELIAWEQALCAGIIPSAMMQRAVGAMNNTLLLDIVANSFYMTHFFSVLALGLLLWINRKTHYWTYVLGLTVLSYSGFLTYVFFPSAPPWWASMNGYMKGAPIDLSHSLLSPQYIFATANPLGAMPSLHAAYPFYLFFYCLYVWGRKAMAVLILPVGVAVSSIYLGHHYVVDILAGIGYAAVVFWITALWKKYRLEAREPVGSLAAV
jgi:membrane-associated phospholipid phosphatase